MKTVNELKRSLDKKYQGMVKPGSEIELKKIPVPSITLNRALGGGFGRGRINMIYGAKSAAKTSLLLQMIADAQKKGLTCVLIDAEQSFEPIWAAKLGVDVENLLVVQAKTFAEAIDIGVALLEEDVDLMVVDSISSLIPGSYFGKNGDVKESSETNQMGSVAQATQKMVFMYNYANTDTCIMLISQNRNKLTPVGAIQIPTGGEAVKYFSSTIVKVTASASEKEQIMERRNGLEVPVGRKVSFRVEWSKTSNAGVRGDFNFYYGTDTPGIDKVAEVVDLAVKLGFVRVSGAWHYRDDDIKFQGRPEFVKYVKANEDYKQELIDKVMSEGTRPEEAFEDSIFEDQDD